MKYWTLSSRVFIIQTHSLQRQAEISELVGVQFLQPTSNNHTLDSRGCVNLEAGLLGPCSDGHSVAPCRGLRRRGHEEVPRGEEEAEECAQIGDPGDHRHPLLGVDSWSRMPPSEVS